MQCFAWLFNLSTGAGVLDSIFDGDDRWCTEDGLANCGGLAGTIVVWRNFLVYIWRYRRCCLKAGQWRALGGWVELGGVS